MSKIVLYPADGYDFDAADVAAYLAGLTSGVFSSAEDFPVTAADGLKVTVGAGRGWVHPSRFTGYSITKREADTLTLPLADPSLPRIDRIVMRYDAGARAASLQVLQGTASSTPTAPAISRTELIYDLCLAEITRPAGSTAVTTGQITDTRLDEKLCGIVRDGVTHIPTAELLATAKARIAELEETASDSSRKAAACMEEAAASAKAAADDRAAAGTHAANAKQALRDTTQARDDALQDINAACTEALDSVSKATLPAQEAAAKAGRKATEATDAAAATAKDKTAAGTSAEEAARSQSAAAKSAEEAKKAAGEAKSYVSTDPTLSTEGAPADAKATGDALEKKAVKTHTHDLSALINALSAGTSTPQDADYYVSQYAGGGSTTTTYHRRPMSTLWAYIKSKAESVFAAKSHTHNYAGSGSAGGSANSAVKLDTATAGSATKPVYISGGKPVACTYSLGKDVPANAVFTDHTYAKMTAATASAAGKEGLVPAPAAGAQGKFLRGDGTWQAIATSVLSAYPVGSIYQSTSSTSPAALFGGTWEQIASERVLMGASSSHKAGTTVNAGLPNITGTANGGVLSMVTPSSDGAFGGKYYDTSSRHGGGDRGDWFSTYNRTFDASKSNPIYGASNTVQPAAYYVYIWHRVS
mgnify:CR=1 FL=1